MHYCQQAYGYSGHNYSRTMPTDVLETSHLPTISKLPVTNMRLLVSLLSAAASLACFELINLEPFRVIIQDVELPKVDVSESDVSMY